MNVAITGSAGHVGHRLVNRLISEGHSVDALVRSADRQRVLPHEANIHVGDVRDDNTIEELIKDTQSVVHLAYTGGNIGKSVNIDATKALFLAAKRAGCDNFIFTSTIGAHPEIIKSDPGSYVEAKSTAAQWLLKQTTGPEIQILYPSRVIGPGDYKVKRFSPYIDVISNRIVSPPLFKFGERNYVHVDTVVDSILAGLFDGVTGQHLVTGETISEKEYFELIAQASERKHTIIYIPGMNVIIPKTIKYASKIGILPKVDNDKIDWKNKHHDLDPQFINQSPVENRGVSQAVEESVDWYQRAGLL